MGTVAVKVLIKLGPLRHRCIFNVTPLARVRVFTAEDAGFVDGFATLGFGGDYVIILRELVREDEPAYNPAEASENKDKVTVVP